VPNRGRDIAPMLCEFGDKLMNYDYFCHIHSKKSCYNDGATQGWREYLFDGLLGKNIKCILTLFRKNPKLGIIYPQNFDKVPYMANHWLSNQNDGAMLCSRLNITMPEGYFNFPAGSMCWLKTSAIRPLFDLKLTWQDFPEERNQNDGTIAHAIERVLGILPIAHGYESLIIKDMKVPSNSPFRIDTQYINFRTYKNMYDLYIKDPQIKVVAFDIFDTLLVRPLINPDHTKKVMITIIENSERHLFENFRHLAEKNIRKKKGKDISIVDIYSEFSLLTGITQERSNELRLLEEKIEIASVTVRKDVARFFYDAKKGVNCHFNK
ncbi:Lipopolysaccharide biosynthesis protein, partial [Candidatus Regiella insecticola 5.15]